MAFFSLKSSASCLKKAVFASGLLFFSTQGHADPHSWGCPAPGRVAPDTANLAPDLCEKRDLLDRGIRARVTSLIVASAAVLSDARRPSSVGSELLL